MKAEQEIILTKWVGLDGTVRIVREREEELKKRFAEGFLRQVKSCEKELRYRQESGMAENIDISYIGEAGEGGIFAALWYLAKELRTGFTVDLKRIPVRQETIEICEYYRLNPYQLASKGCFLITAGGGEVLAEVLRGQAVHAEVIGHLTNTNDKILKNGDDIRYLDRPAPDEIYKICTVF